MTFDPSTSQAPSSSTHDHSDRELLISLTLEFWFSSCALVWADMARRGFKPKLSRRIGSSVPSIGNIWLVGDWYDPVPEDVPCSISTLRSSSNWIFWSSVERSASIGSSHSGSWLSRLSLSKLFWLEWGEEGWECFRSLQRINRVGCELTGLEDENDRVRSRFRLLVGGLKGPSLWLSSDTR